MNDAFSRRADRLAGELATAGPDDSPVDSLLVTNLTNVELAAKLEETLAKDVDAEPWIIPALPYLDELAGRLKKSPSSKATFTFYIFDSPVDRIEAQQKKLMQFFSERGIPEGQRMMAPLEGRPADSTRLLRVTLED